MSEFIHFFAVSLIITIPAIGVGIGQGLINRTAVAMINEQPAAEAIIRRIAILSLTLCETALILSVVMGFVLILSSVDTPFTSYLYGGIILSVAVPGCLVGIFSSWPGRAAIEAAARQPLFAQKILQLLLLTQSIVQTPAIFGFIIGLLLSTQLSNATNYVTVIKLFSAGLAFCIGCIGPLIGLARLTSTSLRTIGTNREIFPELRTFTLISQALTETPLLFTLIISLTLLGISPTATTSAYPILYIAAAFAMGGATLGTGIASGTAAASAITYMGKVPTMQPILSRMAIITQALTDTSSIWGLITAILLVTR